MVTWLALILTHGALLFAFFVWGHDFPRLSRRLLAMAAFFPVIGILNHNLDNRSMVSYTGPSTILGPLFVMSPVYLAIVLGFVSFVRSPRGALPNAAVWPLALTGLYAVACFVGLPWSYDSAWSLSALLWSLPMFFLACLCGLAVDFDKLADENGFFLAFLGLAAINLGLVFLGLSSGRAESLMGARNFGSVYASNSMIAMTVLIGPFAFVQARKSWFFIALFVLASILVAGVSLSRSALFVAVLLAGLLVWSLWRGEGRKLGMASVALLPALGLLGVALADFVAGANLGEAWLNRFFDPESGSSRLEAALSKRSDIFVQDLAGALETPLVGRGYGSVAETSTAGFTDLHNLTFTELYENGGLAAATLVVILALTLLVGFLSPIQRDFLPVTLALAIWIVLAHTTGSTLALRSPGGYNTPIHGAFVFLIVGTVFRGASRAFVPRPMAVA
ncbi:MAG: hypothetical protein KF884_04030 [Fimbriimonadaceae bacterium]|nr:hypothetical protein [Fimbriimonadaceae bacterium]QYK59258.1 MAG: hypothetical protein KF884_04030 [Fimbriimonadaceae bacterium]